jgi:hypothetical protein
MAGNACPGSGPATTATRTGLPCHSLRYGDERLR